MKKEIIGGIDLGTTKVCAVIAEREEGKQFFNVLGFGMVVGLAALFVTMIIAVFIILLVFLHIMGQWAGSRVLKGDDYHYPLFGKLIEKRLSKTVEIEERPA